MLATLRLRLRTCPHVCLLFATDAKGQMLYEKMVEGKFVLGDGREE